MNARLRPGSIRARLTLWYAAALTVGLLVYAGTTYALLQHGLSADLDRQLHADFERAEHSVVRDGETLRWLSAEEDHDEGPPETWVECTSPGGALLLRRPHDSAQETAVSYRVRSGPYAVEGLPVTIRVGRSEAGMRAVLQRVFLVLGIGLPLVVVLAALGGYVLARRALAPVDEMAAQTRAITAERLTARLPVANPDDELGRLASVMNDLLARLEASFDQLRRFTADASHELRTPLTAIRSVGEVGLQEQRKGPAYREVIGSMLEEADRLTRMVDGLLTLSRADAGRVPIERTEVDLSALLREVVEHLAVLAEEKEQTIKAADGEALPASVDPVILRQALINLLDNAIKYAPAGSQIDVGARTAKGALLLEVGDAGPGIPPEHQERVFDRFYRVETARGGKSTGLGLSIATWAVQAHGGRIELDSDANGSTFRIVLPAPTTM
ncbi:ATP-binding protein [Planctomycetota bacterium]|nr:ATP-binding protein [Planctomycetota bacterium]